MNKRGFTLIELITTFALSAVIVTLLVNIILVLKNMYSKSNIKTELIINQGNLSSALNSKINYDNLISYSECSDASFCYNFNFSSGESIALKITDSYISFGNYVYKLLEGSQVLDPSVSKEYVSLEDVELDNSFLVIKIPITNKLYPNEDFGINLVYPYNSNKISL